MAIKITADSTIDLTPELLKQYDISIMPLSITLNGIVYKDTIDITPDDIYEAVSQGLDIPTTSAINVGEYLDFFKSIGNEHQLIHFNLGSKFSSTHQNARIAASELDYVSVIDTANLSTGSAHLVLYAAQLIAEGKAIDEIVESVLAMVPKVRASFVLDSLEYIRKGGRVNALVETGATKLKLHPLISVIDGQMSVGKLYRGTYPRPIRKYVLDLLEKKDMMNPRRAIITHSGVSEEVLQEIYELVNETNYFKEILITRAGCTISCHCGPKTLGLLLVEK